MRLSVEFVAGAVAELASSRLVSSHLGGFGFRCGCSREVFEVPGTILHFTSLARRSTIQPQAKTLINISGTVLKAHDRNVKTVPFLIRRRLRRRRRCRRCRRRRCCCCCSAQFSSASQISSTL